MDVYENAMVGLVELLTGERVEQKLEGKLGVAIFELAWLCNVDCIAQELDWLDAVVERLEQTN